MAAPRGAHTPPRSVRVEGALWRAARARAAAEGRTITDVIVDALRAYVAASDATRGGPRA